MSVGIEAKQSCNQVSHFKGTYQNYQEPSKTIQKTRTIYNQQGTVLYCYSVQNLVQAFGNSVFIVINISFSKMTFMQPSNFLVPHIKHKLTLLALPITTRHLAPSVSNQSLAPGSQYQRKTSLIKLHSNVSTRLQQTGSVGAAGGAGPERQQAEGRAHHHPQLPAAAHAGRPFQLHQHLPGGPTAA